MHGDGIEETPYARDPGSVAVTEGLFRDLEARADTGDRRRPREVSPVRPARRARLYEDVVQTHSSELERPVAVEPAAAAVTRIDRLKPTPPSRRRICQC